MCLGYKFYKLMRKETGIFETDMHTNRSTEGALLALEDLCYTLFFGIYLYL